MATTLKTLAVLLVAVAAAGCAGNGALELRTAEHSGAIDAYGTCIAAVYVEKRLAHNAKASYAAGVVACEALGNKAMRDFRKRSPKTADKQFARFHRDLYRTVAAWDFSS